MDIVSSTSKASTMTLWFIFMCIYVTFYSDRSYDVCSIHVTLFPCQEKNECQIENGMPFCRQKVDSPYTESIIIAGILGAFGCLLLIAFMLVVLCRIRRNKKKKMKQRITRQQQRLEEQTSL